MSGIPVIDGTEQGTEAWLAARRCGIGGSEIAALMGANPYATPLDVWLAKTGMAGDGPIDSIPAEVGHVLEPFVARLWLAERPGWSIRKPPALLRHPDVEVAIASLDYVAERDDERIALEIKTTQQDWLDLPERVWWQAQWQLAVTGMDRAEVAVLVRNRELRIFDVEGDRDAQLAGLDEAYGFWRDYVLPQRMPDVDPVRDSAAINKLWTPTFDKEAELDADLVQRWRDLKASLAALKTDLEEAESRIKLAMADATEGLVDGLPVLTWRPSKPRTSVDVDKLKRDGIYSAYVKQGEPVRSLRAVRRTGP